MSDILCKKHGTTYTDSDNMCAECFYEYKNENLKLRVENNQLKLELRSVRNTCKSRVEELEDLLRESLKFVEVSSAEINNYVLYKLIKKALSL